MDLAFLRSYLVVVDMGSLKAAAQVLGISRGTLKRRLDRLEGQAGAALLHRGSGGIETTRAGEVLAEHARRMVSRADRVISSLNTDDLEPSGHLEVVAPVGMTPSVMIAAIRALMTRYPKLDFTVHTSRDPLQAHGFRGDVLVYFGDQLPRGAWVTKTLHRLELRVMGSPMYLAQHGTPTSVEELLEHELMAWDYPCDDPCRWSLLGGGDVVVEPRFQTTDLYGLWLCLGGGQGLGLAPVTEHVALGEARMPLVPVLEDVVGMSLDLRLAWAESIDRQPWLRPMLAIVDALIEGHGQF